MRVHVPSLTGASVFVVFQDGVRGGGGRSHVLCCLTSFHGDRALISLYLSQDLKKPLRVTFIGPGGVPEEGLDEGGVSREFFQLLVSDMTCQTELWLKCR